MKSKIKVAIAEDNQDAQEIIASFIEPLDIFEVIGFVDNGESLLDLNLLKKPDLIIADISMPKLNGIEAIKACLKINPKLKFIFTTAYDKYAVKAFDLNAVDYVMKPIRKERLYVALEKTKMLMIDQNYLKPKPILTIQTNRSLQLIHFSKIIYIEKVHRKTIIHTKEKKYETNETLDSIYKKLSQDFFRTHRSFIVNLYYISRISVEGETYLAHLRECPHYIFVSKLRIKQLYNQISYISENSK